jgi:hypothetical protein
MHLYGQRLGRGEQLHEEGYLVDIEHIGKGGAGLLPRWKHDR